jgi:glycosyltransferase involved in cell wall biosynthesis
MAGARHGGAEAFFVRLVLALAKVGVAQSAAIRTAPERATALHAAGIEVQEMRFGGRLDLFTRWRLARLADRFRPDVALAWMSRAAAALPASPKGVHRFARVGRLGGYYDLKYYRACDHLVGNTEDIVDWIRAQGWPAERVHYLPNFVDATPAAPIDRAALATPEDAPVFLALGRLHQNKAFDVAIAALTDVPGAHLWLAGAGPLEADLKDQARRLGVEARVRFLGWRDDAPALIAAADAVLCPSRIEPLGNVVIEAWAHGRPVVAARAKGPAALISDGTDGLLVPVDDSRALASAMARVAASPDLRALLAEGGRAAHRDRFAEAAVVARWVEFLGKVAPCAA